MCRLSYHWYFEYVEHFLVWIRLQNDYDRRCFDCHMFQKDVFYFMLISLIITLVQCNLMFFVYLISSLNFWSNKVGLGSHVIIHCMYSSIVRADHSKIPSEWSVSFPLNELAASLVWLRVSCNIALNFFRHYPARVPCVRLPFLPLSWSLCERSEREISKLSNFRQSQKH